MDKPSHTKPWNAGSLLILGLGAGICRGLRRRHGAHDLPADQLGALGPDDARVLGDYLDLSYPGRDFLSVARARLRRGFSGRTSSSSNARAGSSADFSHRVRLDHLDQPPLLACLSTPGIGCLRGLHSLVRKTGRRVRAILEENYTVDGRGLGTRVRRNSRRQMAA